MMEKTINFIVNFKYYGKEIVKTEEEVWLAQAKACQWGASTLSEETKLWLDFQALIRNLLSSLLNGVSRLNWGHLTDWLYYLSGDYKWWKISLSPQQRHLLGQIGLPKFQQPYLGLNTLVELLKESEAILSKVPEDILLKKTEIRVTKEFHMSGLNNFPNHCRGLDGYFSLYIHGSKATNDDTPFSDIDDLLILHTNAWKDLKSLKHVAEIARMISRIFQDIDPLQHHGHWVYSDLDLQCFDESIIPLIVLESAKIVCGQRKLEVAVRHNPAGFRKILWAIIQEVRRDALAAHSGKINLYWLKNLISGISLLPALTFQVQGEIIAKKSAILRAYNIYSKQACEAICWASKIRENWAIMPTYSYLPLVKLTARIIPLKTRYIAEFLARKLLPVIPCKRIDGFKEVLPSILTLTDESAVLLKEAVLHEVS